MLRKVSAHCPTQTGDAMFCQPEVLLLESLWLWSQSPGMYTYVHNRLVYALGATLGQRAAKAVKMMAHILGLHTRRTFYLRLPGSRQVTADERALIGLMSAQLHGARSHATAIATWLFPYKCHGTFLAVAGELARALSAGGYELARPREVGAPIRCVPRILDVA